MRWSSCVFLSLLLGLTAGCSKPPPAVAPAPAAAVPTAVLVEESPIARLLGKPVRRDDCLSPQAGIGAVEVGLQSLVLAVLTAEMCRDLPLPQLTEVDTFLQELNAGATNAAQAQLIAVDLQLESPALSDEQRQALEKQKQQLLAAADKGSPQAQPFDQARVEAKLEDIRRQLALPQLPWLQRIALEGQERAQQFALEQKSALAPLIYAELMPLHCKAALYKKYGGKVVARQISIEPAEAYFKLA